MDPRDLLRAFPDGIACTVCDQLVPAARIQLLAQREDMTFVQIECAACRSTSLGFLAGPSTPPATAGLDASRPEPISSDDVIEMHQFLNGWHGDVQSLVESSGDRSRQDRSMRSR